MEPWPTITQVPEAVVTVPWFVTGQAQEPCADATPTKRDSTATGKSFFIGRLYTPPPPARVKRSGYPACHARGRTRSSCIIARAIVVLGNVHDVHTELVDVVEQLVVGGLQVGGAHAHASTVARPAHRGNRARFAVRSCSACVRPARGRKMS